MAGGLGHSVGMFLFLLYLIWKLHGVVKEEEALFPRLALPGVMLEPLREYLLERSLEVGRISCSEEPVSTCCETGGTVSASQPHNAHPRMGDTLCRKEESWQPNSFGLSTPKGEIRWEALCGCSLGGLWGQATVHTWGLSKHISNPEILPQPQWGIILP